MSLYKVHKIILHDNCYFTEKGTYKSENEWNLDVSCSVNSLYIPVDSDIASGELVMQEIPEITPNTAKWKVWKFWFDKIMSAPENWFQ